MRRNFNAVDAIAFAFGFGIKSVPTALRLGWPALGLCLAGSYLMATSGVSGAMSVWSAGLFGSDAASMTYSDSFKREALLATGLIIASYIALIPLAVGLLQRAAGAEVRGGVLPLIGKNEVSFIASYIVSYFSIIPVVLVLALLAGLVVAGAGAAGLETDSPLLIGSALVPVVVGLFWYMIRISLFPAHAAVTGEIKPLTAFGLLGGRFWKFLGATILLTAIIAIVSLLFDLLVVSAAAFELYPLAAALDTAVWFFAIAVSAGFYGRIVSELLASGNEPGPYDEIDVPEDEGAAEFADESAGPADAQPEDTRSDYAARPMMRRLEGQAEPVLSAEEISPPQAEAGRPRSSIGFVRHRFRR